VKNIVHAKNNELLVSLDDVANFSNIKYESIRRLVSKNINEFLELGLSYDLEKVDFKSTLFNEPQTTFLITLMRNNHKVTRFKLDLVKQFYRMKKQIDIQNSINLASIKKQLQISQSETKSAKRKSYGYDRIGNFQCVTNILRNSNADISAEVFNKMLLSKNILIQKEVKVKKYFANEKESIVTKDGNILIHFDSAIKVLEDFDVVFKDDSQIKMEF